MNEYYRLAYVRKPEFMGNTRTEEKDPKFNAVSDLPWTEREINTRIEAYRDMENKVISIAKTIPPEKQNAWFELIEYPVRGAAEMNKKILYAQLARHGKANWKESDAAFDSIVVLTQKYNSLAGGKWKNMMSSHPRNLSVFQKLAHQTAEGSLAMDQLPIVAWNGDGYAKYEGEKPIGYGLGYQRGAIHLQPETSVTYQFEGSMDSIWVEVALAPNHPVSGKKIRYAIAINGAAEQVIDYHTEDRNEEWKVNVLTNQAIRVTGFKLQKNKSGRYQTIRIRAVDEGVVIDQVKVWGRPPSSGYVSSR